MALAIIIQLGVMHFTVAALAARFQIVACQMDIHAGARIGAVRSIHGSWSTAVSDVTIRRVAVCATDRSAVRAAKMSIVIEDVAAAFPVVIKLGVNPVTVTGLATCMEIVTAYVNIAACLAIAACGTVCILVITAVGTRTISSDRSSTVRRAGDASQLAIFIRYVALALAEIVELGVAPCAVTGLAARMQIIASHFYVTAGLHIRSIRTVSAPALRRPITRIGAAEISVIVADLTGAALERWK